MKWLSHHLPSWCFALAASAPLLLGACTHVATATKPADLSAESTPAIGQANGATVARQEWQGRLSLLIHDEPPQHLHAAFTLQGSVTAGSLTLTTPLGSAVAQALWQPGVATLTQNGQTRDFASLEDMLRQTSLSATPIAPLFEWLQGRESASEGWQVDLSQYAQGRINAIRQYPAPPAEIKIILEEY